MNPYKNIQLVRSLILVTPNRKRENNAISNLTSRLFIFLVQITTLNEMLSQNVIGFVGLFLHLLVVAIAGMSVPFDRPNEGYIFINC